MKMARESFNEATKFDPRFQLAVFYRSVVASELRDADAAIQGFEELLKASTDFRAEVLLQLAYAHIKRYRDDDYFKAEQFLTDGRRAAKDHGQKELVVMADALKVFLYSVMGGRLSNRSSRLGYLEQAVRLGEGLLIDQTEFENGIPTEARFEVLNGLGIAYTRKGEKMPASRQEFWTTAEARLKEALDLRPTSVRAMQNMGLLQGMQGFEALHDGKSDQAGVFFQQARDRYRESLDLNPNDQYPHYRMSQLSAVAGDWEEARRYFASGQKQNGAVKPEEWSKLQAAIDRHDASGIDWL
ncbi:MAG: tetratricopeptide repeat protein [Acidobacteriia bacterium]|nr:tetratricopeptide repeat protein [Terriglobia bacterium]